MFSRQLPLPKFRNANFPKFKIGILQARYPLVDFASSSPPPPSDTTTGDHHCLPSLSSFFSFFPISPFLRSCVRHPCSWSYPLSASSSTDKQPPAAATFCATATSPPPHCLSFLLPHFINAEYRPEKELPSRREAERASSSPTTEKTHRLSSESRASSSSSPPPPSPPPCHPLHVFNSKIDEGRKALQVLSLLLLASTSSKLTKKCMYEVIQKVGSSIRSCGYGQGRIISCSLRLINMMPIFKE
ncbi:uncharacterized protein DS421_9g260990 [Arachis hypogaea]|nr:uncharacterized protein DS421_9g260990 [Arachis hypogaea]